MRVRLKLFTRRKVLLFKEIMVESEMREADRVFRCLPLYLSLSKRRRETHSSLSLCKKMLKKERRIQWKQGEGLSVYKNTKYREREGSSSWSCECACPCLSLSLHKRSPSRRERERERLQGRKEGRKEALKRALTLNYLSLSLSLSLPLSLSL
jgi:hypothetical protein